MSSAGWILQPLVGGNGGCAEEMGGQSQWRSREKESGTVGRKGEEVEKVGGGAGEVGGRCTPSVREERGSRSGILHRAERRHALGFTATCR